MNFNILSILPALLWVQKKVFKLMYPSLDVKSSDSNSYSSNGSKTYMTANTTLELTAKTQQKAQKVNQNASKILKKFIKKPEQILKFMEAKGTKVIKAPHMNKVLTLIGENEGFITPITGFKALYLTIAINLLSKKKVAISFKTEPMFVTRNLPLNLYSLAHQFYHWVAFVQKMPGYEQETVEKFKDIWRLDATSGAMDKLSFEDVMSLRSAIARDVEAIDFVKNFTREMVGAKDSLNKMKNGQTVNI